MKVRPAWFVALAIALVTTTAATAGAQEDLPGEETTTSTTVPPPPESSTTTTAPPPSSTTTTSAPGGKKPPGGPTSTTSSTTTTLVPGDFGANNDGLAEEVPDVSVTIPPPMLPMPVPGAPVPTYQPSRVVVRALPEAEAHAEAAALEALAAKERVAELRRRLVRLQDEIRGLRVESRVAVQRLARARQALNERVAWAYMRGPLNDLSGVLESRDPTEASTRLIMANTVMSADQDALEEYQDARKAVDRDLAGLSERVIDTRRELRKAKAQAKAAAERAAEAELELQIFSAGSEIVIHGFVFPVADPHNFVDTFGAPRMPGTMFAHFHQGTDIFAPSGTELQASERGVIARMGTDVLGGIKLWLVGESGVYYYYAHLLAYAPGLHEGQVVEPGDVVGFVGNTGNARTTPSHLHFEIHPGGGLAVNPYPLLKFADDNDNEPQPAA